MTLWLTNLAAYSAQFAVLVATAVAVTWLLRLRQPRTSLMFWRSLAAVGLVLPVIQPWSREAATSLASTALDSAASSVGTAVDVITSTSGSGAALIVAAILTGVVVRLAWLVLGLLRLRRLTSAAEPPVHVPPFFTELAEAIGTQAEYRICDAIGGPATIGVCRPVVFLPRRVFEVPRAVQRAIVCHELIHVRRRDWVHTVLEEFVCAVLWFHPGARVLASRICLAREMLVDQETIARTGDRRAYAEALLAFSSPEPHIAAVTPLIRERHRSHRIALITQEVSMSAHRVAATLIIAVAAVVLSTAVAIAGFPMIADGAASQVYVPGQDKDLTLPRVLRQVKPEYTAIAKEQKIQGTVLMKVVVLASGDVGDVEVTQSLDTQYGLDDQAVLAVRQWKFEPGRKDGKAVSIQVTIEMTFTLR